MLRKILVPNDFSPASEAAREYATFLAEPFGAAVDLLYVWTDDERAKGHRHIAFPQELPMPLEPEGAPPSERKPRVACRGRVEAGALCATVLRVGGAEASALVGAKRCRWSSTRWEGRRHADGQDLLRTSTKTRGQISVSCSQNLESARTIGQQKERRL